MVMNSPNSSGLYLFSDSDGVALQYQILKLGSPDYQCTYDDLAETSKIFEVNRFV